MSGSTSAGSVQAIMNTPIHWCLYMLLCDEKMFYVGITDDLVFRLTQHHEKQSFFTKQFSHVELVYCERYKNKFDAAKREKQLKGWSHIKKQKLVAGELGINTCTEYAKVLLLNGLKA
jgi:putative endonuclease